ncbi:MAG TPA: DUF4279 domain-containing protein [Pyrinomonadaceae bacterium]|nr:DUF4279 domain-containing protein [Pyrinomonadaceae bacterium]
MEKDNFRCETKTSFTIKTFSHDCLIVSEKLDLQPTRTLQAGQIIGKGPQGQLYRSPHGLWALEYYSVGENVQFNDHLIRLREILESKVHLIKALVDSMGFEAVMYLLIMTEDAGAGIDLDSSDLSFISRISTRFTCSVVANQ